MKKEELERLIMLIFQFENIADERVNNIINLTKDLPKEALEEFYYEYLLKRKSNE